MDSRLLALFADDELSLILSFIGDDYEFFASLVCTRFRRAIKAKNQGAGTRTHPRVLNSLAKFRLAFESNFTTLHPDADKLYNSRIYMQIIARCEDDDDRLETIRFVHDNKLCTKEVNVVCSLAQAAYEHSLPSLMLLDQVFGHKSSMSSLIETYKCAAYSGDLRILQWMQLRHDGVPDMSDFEELEEEELAENTFFVHEVAKAAAQNGKIVALAWLFNATKFKTFDDFLGIIEDALKYAAFYGHTKVLEWIVHLKPTKISKKISNGMCFCAAWKRHDEFVAYMRSHSLFTVSENVFQTAVACRNPKFLKSSGKTMFDRYVDLFDLERSIPEELGLVV